MGRWEPTQRGKHHPWRLPRILWAQLCAAWSLSRCPLALGKGGGIWEGPGAPLLCSRTFLARSLSWAARGASRRAFGLLERQREGAESCQEEEEEEEDFQGLPEPGRDTPALGRWARGEEGHCPWSRVPGSQHP